MAVRRDGDTGAKTMTRNTYGGRQEGEKGGVVAFPYTVVHPLAVMIATVHAIIALSVREQHPLAIHQDRGQLTLTILQ